MKNSTLYKAALSSLFVFSFSAVQADVSKQSSLNTINDENSVKDSENTLSSHTPRNDYPGWDIKLGAGVASISSPWIDGRSQNVAIPFYNASIGNWHIGGEGLVSYQTVVANQLGVAVGIDHREDGYQSKFSKNSIFSGYESPDEEIIATVGLAYGEFSMQAAQDISNKSESTSLSMMLEIPIYESPNGFAINLNTAAHWYSSEYVNYNYGVSNKQVDNSVGRTAYQGEAAVNYEVGLSALYLVNPNWMILGSISHTKLHDEIVDSPLIEQSDQSVAALMLVYQM